MRQIRSVVKETVPTIGNCVSAQITASVNSTQRVGTLLTMKPTTIAEIENRKKNDEPSRPNCSGSSFSSVMIGTPARPTTILSAKFTSMKRNRRNAILQAPFGVGCAVMMVAPQSWSDSPVDRLEAMLATGYPAMQLDILTGSRAP